MSSFLAWGTAASEWGNMFIPRNGGIEGKLGKSHFFIDTSHGGELTIVTGAWPDLEVLVRATLSFQVRCDNVAIEVKQGFDCNPRVEYLEEGSQRLGIRVHLQLYDAQNRYYGHGVVEAWAYPNGEIFCAYGASFDGLAEADSLQPGSRLLVAPSHNGGPATVLHDATLEFHTTHDLPAARLRPQRALLYKLEEESVELRWQSTSMRYDDILPHPGKEPPAYDRWPTYFPQAYAGIPPETARQLDKHIVSLHWPTEGLPKNPTYVSLFRLSPRKIPPPQANLPLEIVGGQVHGNQGGYNDLEGAYTVRLRGKDVFIRLPEVSEPQRITIKVIGLPGDGGVMAILDEEPFVPQLVSQGGLVDNPLAPLCEVPDGPADTAVVTTVIDGAPHGLAIRCLPGIQLTYQSRDPLRQLRVYDGNLGGTYSRFQVGLARGRIQRLRMQAKPEWALTDLFLFWFHHGSAGPADLANVPYAFKILKNGPSDIAFQYSSRNATSRIASSYEVRMPVSDVFPVLTIRARLEILDKWPHSSAQFCNAFPFPGIDPGNWWYQRALCVAADGRFQLLDLLSGTSSGDDLSSIEGAGFFALSASDRGNIVILVTAVPRDHGYTPVINLHHVNWQLNLQFVDKTETRTPPSKGARFKVNYQLALWGDSETSVDDLLIFGRACLDAGRLLTEEFVRI